MPKKIDVMWDKLILEVRVANPTWGGTRIQNAIKSWGQKQGLNKDDVPSVRTIEKRIQAKIEDEKVISIKRAYFPESFESGDIPWEAAPYVIEFINMYPQLQIGATYDSGFIGSSGLT